MSYTDANGNVDARFARLLVVLAEGWSQTLNEHQIKLYAEGLSDIPYEQLQRAARAALRECRFFPKVAELRQFAVPATDDAALLAWAGFQRAASAVGSWSTLVVEDGYAGHAMRAVFGSWPAYCETDDIGVASRRQEFLAAYREARRIPGEGRPTVMNGRTELSGKDRAWAGRLTASGTVQQIPLRTALEALGGDIDARAALPQGGVEEDRQGAAEAAGAHPGGDRAGGSGGPGRVLPTPGGS